MAKTKTLKRTLTFILTLSMLLCCIGAFGSVQASAATERVSMYLFDPYFSKYGSTSAYVYIQTNDNASNQQVYVHYHYINDEWLDAQAEYLTTLADGSKIWKANITCYGTEYAIKYVADGEVIWDNNNGKNYGDELLGSAPITVNRTGFNGSSYPIVVTLQNYSYQKDVQVRYTVDNWKTYEDAPLSYKSTTEYGTEIWETDLSISADQLSSFQYCVCYKEGNNTYWANNFGQNYDSNYVMHR